MVIVKRTFMPADQEMNLGSVVRLSVFDKSQIMSQQLASLHAPRWTSELDLELKETSASRISCEKGQLCSYRTKSSTVPGIDLAMKIPEDLVDDFLDGEVDIGNSHAATVVPILY